MIIRKRTGHKAKHVTTKLLLIVVLCGLFTFPIYAQQKLIRFQHIDPAESFATRYIMSMTQDEQGFLWFSSLFGGLARYDGYEFKIYRHDPDNPNSLPTNEVHALQPDLNGGMWVATDAGLVMLDTKTEQMTIYRHEPDNPQSLSHSNISIVIQDSQDILWVATENGLNRKDPGSEDFRHYPLNFEQPNPDILTPYQWVWCLFEDSHGQLWVGTLGGGLLRYDRAADHFTRILNDPDNPESLPNDVVRTITEDQDGSLWVGTGDGFARLLDQDSPRFERFDPRELFPERNLHGVTTALLFDQAGNLWAGIGGAVIVRPAGTDLFEFFQHDPADPGSLGNGRVWTIFEDRSDVLWMLTDSISWMVPSLNAFSLFPKELPPTDEDHLTLDSSNRLWTGSQDGLIGLDLDSGEWSHHVPFAASEGSRDNSIKGAGIYEDANGKIWVSTPRRLNQFDPASGNFETIDLPAEPNAMFMGSDGLMWMALPFKGLGALDVATQVLQIFASDESDPTSVSHNFGYAVLEDSKNRLWYGTQHGLNLFDRSTGKATRYFNIPSDVTSLSNNTVRQIFEDTSGRLWIGTQYGLSLLGENNGKFIRYFNGKGASDNVFSSIVSFGDKYLWLATDRGIARFDTSNGKFNNYSYADGLPSGFKRVLQAGGNGILYTPTMAGFVAIDTKKLEYTSDPPPIVLTDFRLFNRSVAVSTIDSPTPLTSNIGFLDNLSLSHSDQVVSFEFATLDFFDPNQNTHQYMLEGLNDRWMPINGKNRVATFTDLAPGEYRLRVRGANRAGIWNETGVTLGINVIPPPWQTWWAYTLYAVAFLMLITSFVQWRTRLLHIRSRELKTAVDERTQRLIKSEETVRNQADSLRDLLDLKERLFTNISHEFRTPLTLMLGPIDNALKDAERPEVVAQLDMARRNGKRVLRLVDQLLELSRLSSEEPLTLSPQPLKPIVEVVSEAFRPYAREKGITLSVMTDENLWVNCESDAIERILMNLVSNSLKFTPKGGRVNVILRELEDGSDSEDDQVELAVFDTGKGIPHDMQQAIFERFKRADEFGEAVPGSGIGLALVKELTDAHGGKATLKSEPDKGTVVTILLPRYRVRAGVALKSDLVSSEALNLEIDTLEQPKPLTKDDGNGKDGEKPQLLVIEDNRDMQVYLYQMLSGDYEVELAGDGEAGLDFAFEQIPDIVVCDVMLPKKDGYQVSHELKTDDRTSHIPIIMLTARSDEDSKLEGLREHVDDFLTKPFNEEELMIRIANLLAVRDIMKARYSGQLHAGGDPRSELREPERLFMERLELTLDKNHVDLEFTITQMADCMALSVRQLQRKLKALTDQQPGHYLRLYRLNRSLALLQAGKRIGDVAYSVGFGSPAHFASCFRAQYGSTPTEYQEGCLGGGVKKVDSGSGPE